MRFFILLSVVLTSYAAFAGPTCKVQSGNSETTGGPIISISAECEGRDDWAYLAPDARMETVIVSVDQSTKQYTLDVKDNGFTAIDVPFRWAGAKFGDYVVSTIMAQDLLVHRIDNFQVIRATFDNDTQVYSDSHLTRPITQNK